MGSVDVTAATREHGETAAGRSMRAASLRLTLTVLAVLPYALGWLAGAAASCAAWAWAAVLVGWHDARSAGEDGSG